MAVTYSNNDFDWCEQLIEVKRNYSESECKNIFKNNLTASVFPGIDEKFAENVKNCDPSKLRVERYYYPVYETSYTATYNWTTEKVEQKGNYDVTTRTDHQQTLSFCDDIEQGLTRHCKPDTYVGRNDQRFYKLSHVDDLDGRIYPSARNYTYWEMQGEVKQRAKNNDPGVKSDVFLNGFSSRVFFVPIIEVTYFDGTKSYTSTINMHNGYGYYTFKMSQKMQEQAQETYKKSLKLRWITAGIAAFAVLFSIIVCVAATRFVSFLVAAAAIITMIVCICSGKNLYHDLSFFKNQYANKGNNAEKVGEEKRILITTAIVCAVIIGVGIAILA